MAKAKPQGTIKKRLQQLTEQSYRKKMQESLSTKVIRILNEAEEEATSGSGKYYITIDKPELRVMFELEELGLNIHYEDDSDNCRISWY